MHFVSPIRLLGCFVAIGFLGFTGCYHPSKPAVTWNLTGTVWMVAELEGRMVGGERIPTLQLEPGGNRVIAFGGVNEATGTYKLEGTNISFSPFISTRMAGKPAQMKIEESFLKILGSVTNYQAKDKWLTLLAGDKVVARAQAVPAKPFPAP